MDIVSRLKLFMEKQQIASSQFADTCNIPRPTLSQILSGRNKKISDELISKIHSSYPSLSILWLMFGEGSMLDDSNIEISASQKQPTLDFYGSQQPEHEMFNGTEVDFSNSREKSPEKFSSPFTDTIDDEQRHSDSYLDTLAQKVTEKHSDSYKKITSIVVFYEDSTYRTFTPAAI